MGRLINVNLEDYNSSGVLGVNEDSIKLSVYSIDENELKSKIIKILLDDPDSDVKKITEDYLIQCLYNATNDPENNPVLFQFFERERQDRMNLRDELEDIKIELKELKEKLGINNYTTDGIVWKNEFEARYCHLENKLINITEKLGKAGIEINYWEN
jgi:hypothetical protein